MALDSSALCSPLQPGLLWLAAGPQPSYYCRSQLLWTLQLTRARAKKKRQKKKKKHSLFAMAESAPQRLDWCSRCFSGLFSAPSSGSMNDSLTVSEPVRLPVQIPHTVWKETFLQGAPWSWTQMQRVSRGKGLYQHTQRSSWQSDQVDRLWNS